MFVVSGLKKENLLSVIIILTTGFSLRLNTFN